MKLMAKLHKEAFELFCYPVDSPNMALSDFSLSLDPKKMLALYKIYKKKKI